MAVTCTDPAQHADACSETAFPGKVFLCMIKKPSAARCSDGRKPVYRVTQSAQVRYKRLASLVWSRIIGPIHPIMQRLRAYSQAHLSIHVAVVGGSLAGLATAFALTRVGHRVTLFEQYAEDAPLPSGGIQIPPNLQKVLVRWGLRDALSKIAVVSNSFRLYTCMFSPRA
jgi:hypothetical protein